MESANHEFTWLSGRAHLSVAQEAQSHNESSQQPKSKPTPLPRHNTVVSEPLLTEKTTVSRPTPLPRIFRRATISSPIYDVPPALQSSIFYVATPRTVEEGDQPRSLTAMDKSVILEFDPILQKSDGSVTQSSVFYVDTPHVNSVEVPLLPGGNSVNFSSNCPESHFQSHNSLMESTGHNISHQDAVSCVNNSDSEKEVHSVAFSSSGSSSSSSSSTTSSSSSSSSSTSCNEQSSGLPQRSTNEEKASSSSIAPESSTPNGSTVSDCESNLNTGKGHNVDRGLLSAVPPAPSFCREPAVKQQILKNDTVPDPASTCLEIGNKPAPENVKDDKFLGDVCTQPLPVPSKPTSTPSSESSTISVPCVPQRSTTNPTSDVTPKSSTVPQPVSDSPKAPIPRPRCKAAAISSHPAESSLPSGLPNCSLSAVPPPPGQQPYRPTSSSSQPTRVPIQVENPFYMFLQADHSFERSPTDQFFSFNRDSDSTNSDSSSDASNEGYGPPQFPPPPPPLCDVEVKPLVEVSDDIVKDGTVTHVVSAPKPEPRPSSPLLSSCSGKSDSVVCPPPTALPLKKEAVIALSKKKETPKPSFPIYHNLIDASQLQEGVYAKISKSANSSSEGRISLPPPLPPRGQQRPPPPRLSHYVPHSVVPKPPAKDSPPFARHSTSRNDSPSSELNVIPHHGVLFRIGRGRKDVVQKWIVLDKGHLQCYADDKMDGPQESFHKSDLLSIAKGTDAKYCCNQELFCFEVATRYCKDRPQVFGARYLSECDSWVERIMQTIAPPSAVLMSGRGILKAGHIYLRTSVTGMWQEGWVILRGKLLEFSLKDEAPLVLDLRKIISLQGLEKDSRMNETDDDGPMFVINYPAITLYIRTYKAFDTEKWLSRIEQAVANKGLSLDEQQMTHDGFPVIVDKCIKFVSTYGLNSKGLYRQSSTNSKIAKLLDNLRKDAHKVHLQPDDYSEHDVANTLKRFLRTLPDALMTKALYPHWITAVGNFNIEHVKVLLDRLPEVNYQTLKRIIAHLYSVSEHSEQNLMTVTNLAQVFGSTLLSTESDINISNAHHEMEIMSYLISHYPVLFGVSAEEMEKEEKIQKALRDLREAKKAQKPAGDILVGIYVYNRHWGKCLNMKLSPSMTALDICTSAVQQTRIKDPLHSLAIFEVVCNENLERPLHHSEIVLSVTLRWACWSDADARDNYLVIRKNEIFHRVLPLARQPLSMFGELRFADVKSKSFKKFMFEFMNARLAYYKDAKISQPLGSWNIEDVTWYIGSEHRRPAPTKWAITFIEQNAAVKTRSKENHFFGHTICFSVEEEFHKWVATLLVGQYPNGILPKIEPVDLLR